MVALPKAIAQDFLEIDQIRQGVVLLRNKGLRGILMVSSLNFALKSEEEQQAILYQFQNFLNSLDFSLQIVVQSRRLNITGYLDKIKQLEQGQTNELLKMQTSGYHEFIKGLVSQGTIMAKNFFTVVPFSLQDTQELAGSFPGKKMQITNLSEEQFQRCRSQLWQRMEFIAISFKRMGLQAVPLATADLIEFFWSLHHPKEAEIGYYPEVPPELITGLSENI